MSRIKEEYQKLFYYESGNLHWKQTGRVAGSKHSSGYMQVNINKTPKYLHRVVWQFHNGEIPPNLDIDHIDGCRTNNNIENLRLVTRSENMQNIKRSYKNSKSGIKGVFYNVAKKSWTACLMHKGTLHSVNYLATKEIAESARKELEYEYFTHSPEKTV